MLKPRLHSIHTGAVSSGCQGDGLGIFASVISWWLLYPLVSHRKAKSSVVLEVCTCTYTSYLPRSSSCLFTTTTTTILQQKNLIIRSVIMIHVVSGRHLHHSFPINFDGPSSLSVQCWYGCVEEMGRILFIPFLSS